jgi:hypothetical protein
MLYPKTKWITMVNHGYPLQCSAFGKTIQITNKFPLKFNTQNEMATFGQRPQAILCTEKP